MSGRGKGGKAKGKYKDKSFTAGLQLPVGRISSFATVFRGKATVPNVSVRVLRYNLAADVGYLAADVSELAGDNKKCPFTRHLQLAVGDDEELSKLLSGVTVAQRGVFAKRPSRAFTQENRNVILSVRSRNKRVEARRLTRQFYCTHRC